MTTRTKWALGIAGLVLILDQASKWAVLTLLTPPLAVTPFLNLILAWNQGISFSLFSFDGAAAQWALSLMALAIVGLLFSWLRDAHHPLRVIGIGLAIGGAIGNVIDRMRFGGVVDFIDFYVGDWHYATFNLADSAIVIGVVLLLLEGLATSKDKR